MTLSPSQDTVFKQVLGFLQDNSNIFMLKGYAGTGKTTLIASLVEYLKQKNIDSLLMAPTGRATEVLRTKTGEGKTIHSCIYNRTLECKEIEEKDVSKKLYLFYFPIKKESRISVIIVDESSMISDMYSEQEFFTFGSGRLLSDLLEFADKSGIRKIIFVGDPAQLPPVTDPQSRAFDIKYFEEKTYKVEFAELTEVYRQKADSGILSEATKMRQLLLTPLSDRSNFSIDPNGKDILSLSNTDIVTEYIKGNESLVVGENIVITYSNAQCLEYNKAIRKKIFGDNPDIQEGDILLINNNSYGIFGMEIFNGDMAKVVSVGNAEQRSIPVSTKEGKKHITLSFRQIVLFFQEDARVISCTILENVLNSPDRDLSGWEQKALYIDFCIRCQHKEGSIDFKNELGKDLYFNALRVKYGYAITCHKAQGGEWKSAFVDYTQRAGLSDSLIRWCYTATTRASQQLYVINPPHITTMSKLQFLPIMKISKPPHAFFCESKDMQTPFHTASHHIGVKLKYLGICDAIKDTLFSIEKVQSLNYMERYDFVSNGMEHLRLDMYYDGAGIFKRLTVEGDDSPTDRLKKIINNAPFHLYHLEYVPASPFLHDLYQQMLSACEDTGIQITNVVERISDYYVTYCLKTDALFASLQFYFKKSMLSTAIPTSEQGDDDEKLHSLISILQQNA